MPASPATSNCDGWVTVTDANMMLQAAAGLVHSGCVNFADVDCDGILTGWDALFILRYVIQLDSSLPVGCALP